MKTIKKNPSKFKVKRQCLNEQSLDSFLNTLHLTFQTFSLSHTFLGNARRKSQVADYSGSGFQADEL